MTEDIFEKYPIGTQIILKEDYKHDIHIVNGYHELYGSKYLDFEDGTDLCVSRIDGLMVEECRKANVNMRNEVSIRLNQIEEAESLIYEMKKLKSNVDIIKGRYTVDAKSFLGVMALGMHDIVTIKILSDDEDEIEQFNKIASRFEVKQS